MKIYLTLIILSIYLSGCIMTKIVSAPIRITGKVVSIIPVVGDGTGMLLDNTADAIDVIGIILD
jgi:hypothetical protein